MVRDSRILFRHGVTDLLHISHRLQIPLFVISAGIKPVIDAAFTMINAQHQPTVISNDFRYCSEGRTIAAPHTDELVDPNTKQVQLYKFAQRDNVVLMGDILQDAYMCCDSKHDTVVRVGFLNKGESAGQEVLNKYMSKFDLVIAGDGSLCPVLVLLECLGEEFAAGGRNVELVQGSEELKMILEAL